MFFEKLCKELLLHQSFLVHLQIEPGEEDLSFQGFLGLRDVEEDLPDLSQTVAIKGCFGIVK